MLYGLYLSTAGAKAQSYRQDVIANNIANVDTTGFRRQIAILQERPDHATEFGAPPPVNPADLRRLGGGVNMYTDPTDFETPGVYQATERNLDVALEGEGFFRIQREGREFLTRNGSFTTDADGNLRSSDGNGFVLGTDGRPIRLLTSDPIDVAPSGEVYQNDVQLGRLAIRRPANYGELAREGDSLYSTEGVTFPADAKVRQRMLEKSNVEPITSMVDLIETARAFDLNIEMIRLQNQTAATLIQSVPRLA